MYASIVGESLYVHIIPIKCDKINLIVDIIAFHCRQSAIIATHIDPPCPMQAMCLLRMRLTDLVKIVNITCTAAQQMQGTRGPGMSSREL